MVAEQEILIAIHCTRCDELLIPEMEREAQEKEIEAEDGETVAYLGNDLVCMSCFEDDPVEVAYLKADGY